MQELANKMMKELDTIVMEELWLINAINAYCHTNNIELTEDEEIDLFDILWAMM